MKDQKRRSIKRSTQISTALLISIFALGVVTSAQAEEDFSCSYSSSESTEQMELLVAVGNGAVPELKTKISSLLTELAPTLTELAPTPPALGLTLTDYIYCSNDNSGKIHFETFRLSIIALLKQKNKEN